MQSELNHIHYSITDIEQYLQGKMNAADMHQMEKAALQDPFLADAIEGYRNASAQQSHQHLEEIEQAIIGKKEDAKIIPINTNKKWKWSVAASVLSIALVGSIVWMLHKKDNENIPVAKTTSASIGTQKNSTVFSHQSDTINNKPIIASNYSKKKSKNNTALIIKDNSETNLAATEFVPAEIKDSVQKMQNVVVRSKEELLQNSTVPTAKTLAAAPTVDLNRTLQGKAAGLSVTNAKSKSNQETEIFVRGNKSIDAANKPIYVIDGIAFDSLPSDLNPASLKNVEILKEAKAVSSYGSKAANGAIVITTNTKLIKGRVITKNGAPIRFATIAYSKDKAVATDSAGYFLIDAKDSLLNATVSSVGFNSANIKLSNKKLNQIEMKESAQNLDEVVVIGYGTQKRKDITGSVAAITSKDKSIANNGSGDSVLMPQGGWENFKVYINHKLTSDTSLISEPVTGNIEFELNLDEDGAPTKVHILQSPDKKLNKQLSEAILEGPKWIIGHKKRRKQKINIQL